MKVVFFLIAAVLAAARCAEDLSASYTYSAVLLNNDQVDDRYELYWSFDRSAETIQFAVRVRTNGWVGFGLSPNGGMAGSDVAIGWVDDIGTAYLHDHFADGERLPMVDSSQDWELTEGKEEEGYTILKFRRDWVTCDGRDRDIAAQTAHIIFSWNDADPTDNDPDNVEYHGPTQRGSYSLNLIGGLEQTPDDPADIDSFSITLNNLTIPPADTTYWCEVFEMPQVVQSQKRYITKFAPIISPNDFTFVHHMLLYTCSEDLNLNESHVGISGPCFSGQFPDEALGCRASPVLAVWAVGGETFYYPENVAFPIGGPGSPRYLVLDMHFDNPDELTGRFDSSGFEISYTSVAREFDAGILRVGDDVSRREIIPPNANDYQIIGWCPSVCTEQYIPEGGITIFANFLHTHLIGHGVVLRHLRNTTSCGGYEELAPIEKNLQYDFNFQQINIIPKEVTILPGDVLLLECIYSSDGVRDNVTLGGTSTREEMCLDFLVYYPRIEMTKCESIIADEAINPFVDDITDSDLQQEIILQFYNGTDGDLKAALDQLEWTPEEIERLQTVANVGPLYGYCEEDQVDGPNDLDTVPEVTCPYVEPDVCADREGGAPPTVAVATPLLLAIAALMSAFVH